MRHRLLLVLRILAVFTAGACANNAARANDLVDCRTKMAEERISACTKVISKGGVDNKTLGIAYSLRGSSYNSTTDRDKAIADFMRAIELDPGTSDAHVAQGLIHMVRNEKDKALAEYGEALRLDPKNARAWNNRGSVYSRDGDTERAIADYTEALKVDPRYLIAYTNRGSIFSRKAEYDRAMADFDEALKIDPQSVTALMHRGAAYGNKGDYDRAIIDFNAVLKINPSHPSAYNERGLAFMRKGDKDKAFADYQTAIRINPKLATAYNNRGLVYLARGDQPRALADFNEAIRLSPNSLLFYSNRGSLFSSRGQNEQALADFNKVLQLPAFTPADKQRQEVVRGRIARLKETPVAPIKHKRVALVIGNGNYANASALTNPINDAKSFAAALRRLGFTQVVEDYNSTRERMGQLLKDFGDQAEGSEWAVVYFAGHGLELNGNTYLVPTDAQLKRDTHVDDEAVVLSKVMAKVDAAKSLGLVILDSCRNNPFVNRMTRSAGATRSISAGLAPIEPDGNVLVAYSARHGTVAEDGNGEHSPFTEALLRYIEEPGLEINFLFRKVRDDVRKQTERRQEPYLYGSLGSEPIFFKTATAAR